ncbi:MAG TPA: N-acetyl-gamma-glutamyl-phosphate reductase [Polyangiaceae bacterium]|nr:N-acetyl-gamma-glutamyl-phosphate reductase [Polyangiaceae bacterium]
MRQATLLGGSGFAGAEILRRLLRHPEIEVVRIGAADHLGQPVAAAHPHLEGFTDLRFEALSPEQAVSDVDVVIMGLPHAASVQVMEAARARDVRVLDLSGAFRLRDAASYQRYYGEGHPHPELLEEFVYGQPEWNRAKLAGARYVASPGCFATCIELSLGPFARAGLLKGAVRTVALTGSSGAGASPLATTHHPTRAHNLRTYKPLEHAHTPEIVENLELWGARGLELSFVPISAPLTRGIFATSFFSVDADVSEARLFETLGAAYASERFVRVPEARLPEVVAVATSNIAEVGVVCGQVQAGRREVIAFGALDNLVKGGAGQAVQNLNLMFGWDEALTLDDAGSYP